MVVFVRPSGSNVNVLLDTLVGAVNTGILSACYFSFLLQSNLQVFNDLTTIQEGMFVI